MGVIKGVGKGEVDIIVENRQQGKYKSVFDVAKRIDLRSANKKAFENLALAGGFDSFENTHRAQYFHDDGDGITFLEKAVKYGAKYQENENSSQVSLFGDASEVQIPEPLVPPCEEWGTMEKLKREKEAVGIYISGHPLDDFKTELNVFCNGNVSLFNDPENYLNKEISVGGVVTDVQHRVSKNGKGWAIFAVEDYTDSYEFRIFGEEYLKYRHFLLINSFVYLKVYIKEGWMNRETGKKGEPRLQFNSIMILQDVMEAYAKKLTIHLKAEEIKEERIDILKSLINSHKGNHALNFTIHETENKIKLTMPSRKQKVNISNTLLTELENQNLFYKLN